MPVNSLFERARWRAGAAFVRWLVAIPSVAAAFAWYLGWLEGLGVAVSFLLALAAFPLAFLSCVLVRHHRDIGRTIGAFLRTVAGDATDGDTQRLTRVEVETNRLGGSVIKLWQAINETTETLGRHVVLLQELQRLSEERNNTIAKEEIRHLIDWTRALSYAQTEACRSVIVQSLQSEAPTPLDADNEQKPEEVARFVHAVNTYIDDVQETASASRLWTPEELAKRINEAEQSGDAVFREAHRNQNLSAEEFSARRRYAIALEKLRITRGYLRDRGRLAETFQMRALQNLQAAEDFNSVRTRDGR